MSSEFGKEIVTAVKTLKPQRVLIDRKNCTISARNTGEKDQPVRVTFTTKVVNEKKVDAQTRLCELAFSIDHLFKGKGSAYPAEKWRAFQGGGQQGFAEKVGKDGVTTCAMFWGVEKRGRWANY